MCHISPVLFAWESKLIDSDTLPDWRSDSSKKHKSTAVAFLLNSAKLVTSCRKHVSVFKRLALIL